MELWRSDGTETGTMLVSDIVPGNDSSSPDGLTDVNGTLYSSRPTTRRTVTSSGRATAPKLAPPWLRALPQPGRTLLLTDGNGTLYFVSDDGMHGWELWKSDGTDAGTVLVKDIRPGAESSSIRTLRCSGHAVLPPVTMDARLGALEERRHRGRYCHCSGHCTRHCPFVSLRLRHRQRGSVLLRR